MKLTVSTPEECPFRKIHYASQFYWYQKCFLVEKPEACLVLCSENRCPLQKKGSATVIWSIQNEKDSESDTQSRREKIDAEFKKTRDMFVNNRLKNAKNYKELCLMNLQGALFLCGQRNGMLAFTPKEDREYIQQTMDHYWESLCSEMASIAEKKGWV